MLKECVLFSRGAEAYSLLGMPEGVVDGPEDVVDHDRTVAPGLAGDDRLQRVASVLVERSEAFVGWENVEVSVGVEVADSAPRVAPVRVLFSRVELKLEARVLGSPVLRQRLVSERLVSLFDPRVVWGVAHGIVGVSDPASPRLVYLVVAAGRGIVDASLAGVILGDPLDYRIGLGECRGPRETRAR
jgi:hypothetical protein